MQLRRPYALREALYTALGEVGEDDRLGGACTLHILCDQALAWRMISGVFPLFDQLCASRGFHPCSCVGMPGNHFHEGSEEMFQDCSVESLCSECVEDCSWSCRCGFGRRPIIDVASPASSLILPDVRNSCWGVACWIFCGERGAVGGSIFHVLSVLNRVFISLFDDPRYLEDACESGKISIRTPLGSDGLDGLHLRNVRLCWKQSRLRSRRLQHHLRPNVLDARTQLPAHQSQPRRRHTVLFSPLMRYSILRPIAKPPDRSTADRRPSHTS